MPPVCSQRMVLYTYILTICMCKTVLIKRATYSSSLVVTENKSKSKTNQPVDVSEEHCYRHH